MEQIYLYHNENCRNGKNFLKTGSINSFAYNFIGSRGSGFLVSWQN